MISITINISYYQQRSRNIQPDHSRSPVHRHPKVSLGCLRSVILSISENKGFQCKQNPREMLGVITGGRGWQASCLSSLLGSSGAHHCQEPMMSGSRTFLFSCSSVSQLQQQGEEFKPQVCIPASCKNNMQMTAFGVAATGDINQFGKGGRRREVSRSRERKKVGEGKERNNKGPDGRWSRVQAKEDVGWQGVVT